MRGAGIDESVLAAHPGLQSSSNPLAWLQRPGSSRSSAEDLAARRRNAQRFVETWAGRRWRHPRLARSISWHSGARSVNCTAMTAPEASSPWNGAAGFIGHCVFRDVAGCSGWRRAAVAGRPCATTRRHRHCRSTAFTLQIIELQRSLATRIASATTVIASARRNGLATSSAASASSAEVRLTRLIHFRRRGVPGRWTAGSFLLGLVSNDPLTFTHWSVSETVPPPGRYTGISVLAAYRDCAAGDHKGRRRRRSAGHPGSW
jgi:hypothetical protein